eukprot:TRINITY_DN3010_c0_g1_i1.p1 TRINITY_DN3010_c0_g1~~TRINITY_DN3010_c0_g1_i1.p1  ORF type:complete len:476 (-),score=81.50 TRINITY_DN3010_c0_g1_i1:73-1500(-)
MPGSSKFNVLAEGIRNGILRRSRNGKNIETKDCRQIRMEADATDAMEETLKRKERLQAMRMEADRTSSGPQESPKSACAKLQNPLNESCPEPACDQTNRFDYYTDPLAAFSGIRKKGRVHGNNHNNPNADPAALQPQQQQANRQQYQGSNRNTNISFHSPSSAHKYQDYNGNQMSPVVPMSPIPRFNPVASPENSWPQQFHPHSNQWRGSNGSSSVPRTFQTETLRPEKSYNWQFARGNPMPGSYHPELQNSSPLGAFPVSRFDQESPSPSPRDIDHNTEVCNPVGFRSHPSPQQGGNKGSPFQGSQGSPGPWTSPSPSFSPCGRGGNSWPGKRGNSGGRVNSWTDYKRKGRGRGFGGGSPSPSHSQGQFRQARRNNEHVSARERPDLFVKRSMVEDPWKDMVPVVMDVSSQRLSSVNNKSECSGSGSRLHKILNQSSSSVKQIKTSKIKENFESGPSLAESLALSLAEAVDQET